MRSYDLGQDNYISMGEPIFARTSLLFKEQLVYQNREDVHRASLNFVGHY